MALTLKENYGGQGGVFIQTLLLSRLFNGSIMLKHLLVLSLCVVKNMTYFIETKNHYLRLALEELLAHHRGYPYTCIIDVSSFCSIMEIISCVRRHHRVSRFVFIGGTDIYSRALSPLISIESRLSVLESLDLICQGQGATYHETMDFLRSYRCMANYSRRDKITIYGMLISNTLMGAALEIGICPKLFYHRVDSLVKKLNMLSRLQAHQFFYREYPAEFVRSQLHDACVCA